MKVEFKFSCRYCGQHIIAEESWKNMQSCCPDCGKKLQIPDFQVQQNNDGSVLIDLSAFSLEKFVLADNTPDIPAIQPDTALKIPSILQQSAPAPVMPEEKAIQPENKLTRITQFSHSES